MINPRYVVMLDMGVIPKEDALFQLWKAMVTDERVVGV